MAWQLHYTSAESGPTGRSGFQFVAETRDTGRPGLHDLAAPHMTYRPPPSAPLAPTPAEITTFPVSLTYEPGLLSRCVYLGRDYSGRYGNFLGHALVLGEGDLVGSRPIEFWAAPFWSDAPANGALDELTELTPGSAVDPEALGGWLSAGGPGSYERLAELLETVRRSLTRGYGRLVLVAEDVEEVVRWIAVISFSLPWAAAARLSFATYSADPAACRQLIVGTTPDVWIPSDIDASVIRLDEPPAPVRTGRFAATAVGFWRRTDLDGLDALGELGDAEPETAAALIALCRGDGTVGPEEQRAVIPLVERGLPDWAWRMLGRWAGLLGRELAAAVAEHGPPEAADPCAARCAALAMRDPALPIPSRLMRAPYLAALTTAAGSALGEADTPPLVVAVLRVADVYGLRLDPRAVEDAATAAIQPDSAELAEAIERTPSDWRETLLAGFIGGLEEASPELRERLLTPEVSALIAGRDWTTAPRTGALVLRLEAAAGRRDRVDATIELLGFAEDREETLKALWRAQPTAAECARLIEALGPEMDASPQLSELPARAFLTGGLKGPDVLKLAEKVRDGLSGYPADDAEATLIAARLAQAPTPVEAARAVDALTELTREGHPDLMPMTRTTAAKALAGKDPRFRTTVVKSVTEHARRWLIDAWLTANRNRDQQIALLEVAIRLRTAGVIIPRLDEWARSQVSNWSMFGSVEAHFKRDAELAAGLRELTGQKRRRIFGRGDG
ncbi:hypothetical protein Aph01nite_38760 [Acrocarpospora phusangensis]|uniref:Uncharacterized protein n=1 Tax=Acrocarpospora phusangensis TaxID=1070424 RepID=A0A919QCQ6_9ACTN|nr:hypothetical protein [Acrocarpospora phusangensis]GIH25566.1 hypothetical protein Aph01nite_38760 [Acrocarpospora phusangensis]